jgi:hypothetical protein
MVKTGSSYCSQSELPLTFGLGKPEEGTILTVEVVWPGAQRESFTDIKPNQSITIQEGKGVVAAEPIIFSRAAPQPALAPQQQ